MAGVETQFVVGQVLRSSSTQYTIIEFIGEGAYGKVAKCQVNSSSELVAVKILKATFVQGMEQELSMLNRISASDADQFNLVKFHEKFEFSTHTCLVFELLGMDLRQYITTELGSSMYVTEIRPIAKQMLVALERLKSLGIIHTDIKTDNVMVTKTEKNILRVKLIDFGVAFLSYYAPYGRLVQPVGYRAPEVCLGLSFSESIDMWGLGCLLARLHLDSHLFPPNCEYLMMKAMVEYLGMPSELQLIFGMHAKNFFCKEVDELGTRWRLLTPKEYLDVTKKKAEEWPTWCHRFSSLDDLLYFYEDANAEESKDKEAFIDFLKHLLTLDEKERFTPTEALQHPYITMSHLSQDPEGSDYLTKAQALMPTETSLSGPSVKDCEAHVAEERSDEVQPKPASNLNKIDNPMVLLSDVKDDVGSFPSSLTTAQALMPTETSLSGPPVKDGEAHVAEERSDEVLPKPASSLNKIDNPMVPLSDVKDDVGSFPSSLTKAQELMPTETSLSGPPVKDGEAHVAEERSDEVLPKPASSLNKIDNPMVPLSDVKDDVGSVQEPCEYGRKEIHPTTQDESNICSLPEQVPNSCDKSVKTGSSNRFKKFLRFVSRTFFCCCCPSVEE